MLSRLDRLAYHGQHLSFLINATVMEEAARLCDRLVIMERFDAAQVVDVVELYDKVPVGAPVYIA